MEIFGLVIVGVYILLVAFVALYSLAQLHLLWTYLKHQFKSITAPVILTFPDVTIQLPIYNELYVVERLIDTVCAIDYPIHKLEIQVIDDSDDELYRTDGVPDVINVSRLKIESKEEESSDSDWQPSPRAKILMSKS